jgi:hypothetical protein
VSKTSTTTKNTRASSKQLTAVSACTPTDWMFMGAGANTIAVIVTPSTNWSFGNFGSQTIPE